MQPASGSAIGGSYKLHGFQSEGRDSLTEPVTLGEEVGEHQQQLQTAAQQPRHHAEMREQRFRNAVVCRRKGKGVKPRQGCASEQLNRESKEGTKTPEFIRLFKLIRADVDDAIRSRFGNDPGSEHAPNYMAIEKPLQFAIELVDERRTSER